MLQERFSMTVPYILLVLCTCATTVVKAYPSGAPAGACDLMTPNHGATAQSTSSNYVISVNPATYDCNDSFTGVTVSVQGATLKGFLCQARPDTSTYTTSGTLTSTHNTVTTTNNCDGEASLTHTDSSDKITLSFEWMPDFSKTDTVYIVCTIVESKQVFWVNQTSDAIMFTGSSPCQSHTTTHYQVEPRVMLLMLVVSALTGFCLEI